jgi:hypothetical protein
MASGGGESGSGGGGLIQQLIKPIMTGKGDPLGLVPEDPPTPNLIDPQQMQAPMVPQDTDRLAFLKAFGVQG